mmetsp:Transcript_12277/g.42584  ORF Transcript_12277/g.42584 Transcript_12277/m.42584 type:complete len:321 (-) Transcript_12277:674-1636(-)
MRRVLPRQPHGRRQGLVAHRLRGHQALCRRRGGRGRVALRAAQRHLRAEAHAGVPAGQAQVRGGAHRWPHELQHRAPDRVLQVPRGPGGELQGRRAVRDVRRRPARELQAHQRARPRLVHGGLRHAGRAEGQGAAHRRPRRGPQRAAAGHDALRPPRHGAQVCQGAHRGHGRGHLGVRLPRGPVPELEGRGGVRQDRAVLRRGEHAGDGPGDRGIQRRGHAELWQGYPQGLLRGRHRERHGGAGARGPGGVRAEVKERVQGKQGECGVEPDVLPLTGCRRHCRPGRRPAGASAPRRRPRSRPRSRPHSRPRSRYQPPPCS